jgi:glyoxylase-like metal-dependent hydrolase (beta-lactamase superfamily II)
MQIAPGVYALGHRTGRAAYLSAYSRAYLLDDGTELTLIDTLADPDAHLVLEQLKKLNRPVTDLKRILLTHAHRSHLMGLARLKRLSGATVCSHEWEADIIEGKLKARPVSLRPVRPLLVYPFRLGLGLGAEHPPCDVDDRNLKDGDKVGPIRVFHVPGHTPGHLVYYWAEQRALFTGDNVVTWPRFGASWPGFQLDDRQFRASLRHMVDSVRSKAELNPPVAVIGVAHGEPITRGAADRLASLVEAVTTGEAVV